MQSHELNEFFYFDPKAKAIGYATTPSIAQEDRNGRSEQNIEYASTPSGGPSVNACGARFSAATSIGRRGCLIGLASNT